MPKAEVGSTKYIANKMKAKGLQRLRWYCQICEKQCRDENGFKQHTMSEGHVRAMMLVGEDPNKYINEYSNQFKRDFLQLLKTAHGEKKVHMNNFYQEYIRDKEHIHMNATKWSSLTEFAKFLGQQGICRVEEGDRGLEIQWIDDSPEAIRRREDVKKRDKLIKGDEAWEAKMLEMQIKAAREEADRKALLHKERDVQSDSANVPAEPVKMSLSLGGSAAILKRQEPEKMPIGDAAVEITTFSSSDQPTVSDNSEQSTKDSGGLEAEEGDADGEQQEASTTTVEAVAPAAPAKVSLSLNAGKPKPTNPLMAKKKNPLSKKRDSQAMEPEKPTSNVERIMREEMERKRMGDQRGPKRSRLG